MTSPECIEQSEDFIKPMARDAAGPAGLALEEAQLTYS